jgi:transcriptional regulator with XRE-family HTH domain
MATKTKYRRKLVGIQDIGHKIKELRTVHFKKTQKEFSKILEATQANLSQIESNKFRPTGSFLLRLAEKFPETDFNWLYYGTGSPLRPSKEIKPKKTGVKILRGFNALQEEVKKMK